MPNIVTVSNCPEQKVDAKLDFDVPVKIETLGPGRSADLATSSWITFSQQFCFLASYQSRNNQDNFITNQRISTYVIARHIFDKIISSKGISLFWKFSPKSQFWVPKIGVPEASHTIP